MDILDNEGPQLLLVIFAKTLPYLDGNSNVYNLKRNSKSDAKFDRKFNKTTNEREQLRETTENKGSYKEKK